jgi:hypothetical protein
MVFTQKFGELGDHHFGGARIALLEHLTERERVTCPRSLGHG